MLDIKKMLTKISDKFKTEKGNLAMTVTTGTLSSCAYARCGSVVYLNLTVKNARADVGGNLFVGKITNTEMIPTLPSNGVAVYGSYIFGAFMGDDGTITIRNTGTSTIGADSTIQARISYLIGGGTA